MLQLTRSIAFFDTETTGLDISKDRIIELCIVKVNTDGSKETLLEKVNPDGVEIRKEAYEKHGISSEDLIGKPKFKDIAKKVFEFIQDCDLGGYNCLRFDIPMLVEEFIRAGIAYNPRKVNVIDALSIYNKYESRKLEHAYYKFTGKKLENAHSAEADILATIEIFEKQCELYKDMPQSVEEISKEFVNESTIDLGGRLKKDDSGNIVFTFGKYKGKTVGQVYAENSSYYTWIIEKSDMPLDTKLIFKRIYQKLSK